MNKLQLIEELHRRTLEIYHNENLKCLRENDGEEYYLQGKNILVWHSETTKYLRQPFNHFENLDNLMFISDEIMYFTSQLFFYRPFLDNPLKNSIKLEDKSYFPYSMYLCDRRYFMFSEITFEKIYAYWGQIANLLAAAFVEKMDDSKIFFSRIVKDYPNKTNESYKWFFAFLENEYAEFNSYRRMIVHHRGLETKFRFDHLKAASNQEEMEKLIKYRNELPEYFKMHIGLTLIGFEKALKLISET